MTDTHGRRGGGREAVVEDERLVGDRAGSIASYRHPVASANAGDPVLP